MPRHVEQKVAPVSHDKDLGKTWVKVNSLECLVIWIFSLPWMIWNSKSWTFSGAMFHVSVHSAAFVAIFAVWRNWNDSKPGFCFFSDGPKGPMCPYWVGQLGHKRNLHHPCPLTTCFLASKYPGWMISWSRLDKISNIYILVATWATKMIIIINFYRYIYIFSIIWIIFFSIILMLDIDFLYNYKHIFLNRYCIKSKLRFIYLIINNF